ncbi:hypothetical protein GCM10027074_43430 [Streptomyces deserti]
MVALASVLLLLLFAPGFTSDSGAVLKTTVAVDAAAVDATVKTEVAVDAAVAESAVAVDVSVRGIAPSLGVEAVGKPCPCEEDTSVRGLLTRSLRTTKAAGAGQVVAAAPVRLPVTHRGCAGMNSPSGPRILAAGGSARSAAALQAFRC